MCMTNPPFIPLSCKCIGQLKLLSLRYTQFVHFIDSFRSPLFHYLTSAGLKALDHTETVRGEKTVGLQQFPDNDSDDDDAAAASAEGG